ncbi:haloacid dehalogenase family hydrolase domain containing protein [Entamoeba nuttalli P19]|uniref:Haloacid dehalogenase family hydrolase domain containing protein n=1 Tax=Entamoeba nuttalli (strain P19) TaxID=1076696 RepID=K2G8C9_ENTNP|nr:haloacid dehalogenase family hydrolase domain containing protein [Entamoeba nuttalli P19]EKE38646.1 haloacid dehalogenase family hydrolase domain containing protein [Entamoeba nuttalli P19]|eukprot:XP_008859020.1 haloacid dehalogenase family hydrolase domain containing protein [Entamoeba nuttalli P19]
MKIKCLMIDHDDTAVNSTELINYPCYVEFMKKYYSDKPILTIEMWYEVLWNIGLIEYYKTQVGLTDEMLQFEHSYWKNYISEKPRPPFFDGFIDLLKRFKEQGGIVAVVSFSSKEVILKHYSEATNGEFIPDEIFGYQHGHPELSKPNTYPIEQLIKKYGFKPEEMVMVDDMKEGLIMASRVKGVKSIGVQYSEGHGKTIDKMKEYCDFIAYKVSDIAEFIGLTSEE